MRLATITNWAYGGTVALTLASATTMLLASSAQERERVAVSERYALDGATSHIDEDAQVLSGLARQYVITQNQSDLIAFNREASDLTSIDRQIANVRDVGASAEELRDLRMALRWASGLGGQQHAAIAAVQAGEKNRALSILFAPEYERELDRVQAAIERFQERIDQRTANALDRAAQTAHAWRTVSEIVLAATGLLFLCVLYFVFRRRVLRPVVRLSDVVTRLAAQDYAAELPAHEHIDEIGDMAQALRIFRDNGLARQQLEQERDTDRRLRDLLSRMTQRMQGCDSVDDLERVVRCFVPEVVPQLAGRLYLLDESRNALVEACAWLDPSASVSEFAPTACWALRRGAEHRAAGSVIDVPCAHIGEAVAVETVCLPLIAQNGTLGLLYLELRPGYDMAAVPELQLKMLAENVGLALDNLRLRDALRELAMADPLTTLANRRHLDVALGEIAPLPDRPVSCIMLDIDHFKRFNDEHGHEAGDTVLRLVGETIRESIRPGDLAFRYGGEEFLLLLAGVDARHAESRAGDLKSRIAELRPLHEGRPLGNITISAGVATSPTHGAAQRLVSMADAALMAAKKAGRNRVVSARPSEPANALAG